MNLGCKLMCSDGRVSDFKIWSNGRMQEIVARSEMHSHYIGVQSIDCLIVLSFSLKA